MMIPTAQIGQNRALWILSAQLDLKERVFSVSDFSPRHIYNKPLEGRSEPAGEFRSRINTIYDYDSHIN
jgi:hypothetical protein